MQQLLVLRYLYMMYSVYSGLIPSHQMFYTIPSRQSMQQLPFVDRQRKNARTRFVFEKEFLDFQFCTLRQRDRTVI
jgi:hypothetical protein